MKQIISSRNTIILLAILSLAALFGFNLSSTVSAAQTILIEGKAFEIGQTYDALYTSYYPEDSRLQGGFKDKIGYPLDPSKPTCASPRQFPYGTVFRIFGTGTSRDGTICVSNDTGGAIVLEPDGAIHIDLLSPDHKTAYDWGRRRGQIIILKIGDGKGPLDESDFLDQGQSATPGAVAQLTGNQFVQTQQLTEAEEKFNITNKILFYNKYTRNICSTANIPTGGAMDKDQANRADVVLRYFTAKGFTLAQAAGIVGNLFQDSHVNPAALQLNASQNRTLILDNPYNTTAKTYQYDINQIDVNDDKQAFGLSQWSKPAYKKELFAQATTQSKHPFDLDLQLTFMWNLLATENKSCFSDAQTPMLNSQNQKDGQTNIALNKASNPIDAATTFHDCFRKSNDYDDGPQAVIQKRGAKAQEYYDNFKGKIQDGTGVIIGKDNPVATISSDAQFNLCGNSNPNLGAIQNLVYSVAWPTSCSYDNPDVKNGSLECHAFRAKPTYIDLMDSAVQKGIYIGGNCGQDCGGFVTNVIVQSGYDTRYNNTADVGGTDAQEAWIRRSDSGWRLIYSVGNVDTAKLLPGDVAFRSPPYKDGHTFLFVGNIPGFDSTGASASYSSNNGLSCSDYKAGIFKIGQGIIDGKYSRWPMAAKEINTAYKYNWYRKVATGEAI